MTTLRSCAGGWCTRRAQCGHYLAANEAEQPSERLCPKGRDGAAQQEAADMTRIRFSTAARVQQVLAVLKPEGITTAQIAALIGVTAASRMSQLMAAAVETGHAFFTFSRVSDTMKTPERVYFPTAADRDRFRAAYDAKMAEIQRHRWRAIYERKRPLEVAERAATRKDARTQREADLASRAEAHAAERAARQALKQQQAQLKAQRAQHNAEQKAQRQEQREREAEAARAAKAERAAEARRQKAEEAEQLARMRKDARAANLTPKRHGTPSPAQPPRGPAFLKGPADESRAKVIKIEPPPPAEPPKFFAAHKPGVYVLPASRWAEAAAA